MRGKKLLATLLLGVGLCFVPVLGYGEVIHSLYETKPSSMDYQLLAARVDYMMRNPNGFLYVLFIYDPDGRKKVYWGLPDNIDSKGKIYVVVQDIRGAFSDKSGIALLDEFKGRLEVIYSFIKFYATDMNTDIIAQFYSENMISLGYFYQGEYHLWEK